MKGSRPSFPLAAAHPATGGSAPGTAPTAFQKIIEFYDRTLTWVLRHQRETLIVAVATMFGAWEGGLTGIATENKELHKFHHDIEAGKYLILVYARKEQGAAVRSMMREKHREVELVAVNKHFINPFSPVRRRHRTGGGNERALQED